MIKKNIFSKYALIACMSIAPAIAQDGDNNENGESFRDALARLYRAQQPNTQPSINTAVPVTAPQIQNSDSYNSDSSSVSIEIENVKDLRKHPTFKSVIETPIKVLLPGFPPMPGYSAIVPRNPMINHSLLRHFPLFYHLLSFKDLAALKITCKTFKSAIASLDIFSSVNESVTTKLNSTKNYYRRGAQQNKRLLEDVAFLYSLNKVFNLQARITGLKVMTDPYVCSRFNTKGYDRDRDGAELGKNMRRMKKLLLARFS